MERLTVLAVTNDENLLKSLASVASRLDLMVSHSPSVPSFALLAKPWHAVIVDAETVGFDSISILLTVKSLAPLSLRCLALNSPDPQMVLRAVNEAQVHCIWLKPVSPHELANSLKQRGEALSGQIFPFILATAIESKHGESHGHSYRVAQYALAIGRQLDLSESDLEALQIGCLLHDIGKISLPEDLASRENQTLYRQHPLWGEQIAKGLKLPQKAISVVRSHHERWDGQGYPDRLREEAIPLLARIAALANAYDHLTEQSSNETPLGHLEINQILLSEAGLAFDPKVVKAFLSLREPEDVRETLQRVTELPALAPIVQKALTLLEREDFDWREVADVVSQDQNLVAQILKLANSAITGLRRKVTSLSTAMKVLGARQLKNLLLTLSVRPLLREQSDLQLWEHSLACALVARDIANQTQLVDPEEAFTAGLLHDIGKVVLARHFPQSFKRAIQIARTQKCPLFIAERLVFSTTHAEVGALLLEQWRIPTPFCKAVAMHHLSPAETQPLAWHLYWANQIVHLALGDYPTNFAFRFVPSSLYPLLANSEQLLKRAMEQVGSVEAVL